MSIDNASCPEQTATCTITVRVSPANNIPFDDMSASVSTVDISAVGTGAFKDYTATTANVNFNGGAQTATFNVPIINDTFREPSEQFTFKFNSVNGATAGSIGTATITDNEVGNIPTFTIEGSGSAAEGNADNVRPVKVTLTNPTGQPASINYATRDGSATSDSAKGAIDFVKFNPTTLQLNWAANEGGAKFINPPTNGVTVKGDTIAEPDEQFFVDFGSPNNGQIASGNPVTITLINDDGQPSDVPKLSVEAIPDKTEGDTSTSTQTVTVTMSPAAGQTVTVDYATSNGTATASTQDAKGDYETAKGTLTFPQGTTSKTFNVTINGDPADEIDETYHVTLSNPANAQLATATRDAKILNDDFGQITTGPGQGGGPHLRLFGATGSDLGGFFAYEPQLTSGIHVARGDFFKADGTAGGDGIDEIVTAPGAFPANSSLRSKPVVRIFAIDGTQRASFFAYDQTFPGGVYVAAGNLDGDPSNGDELIVGAAAGGGPHVKVLRIKGPGDNVGQLASFFAYDPKFGGGVRVAAGNVAGDAKDEIVTAPGPGGGPHVRIWTPTPDGAASEVKGFMAYGPEFTGGVFVAAANGRIATGPGAGGGPHVRLFDATGAPLGGGFMAYDQNFHGGVSVALGNLDNNPDAEVIVGPGAGGGPHVRIFRQDGSLPFGNGFFAYDTKFSGGVEVAVSTGA
jgi:hypothetical protein